MRRARVFLASPVFMSLGLLAGLGSSGCQNDTTPTDDEVGDETGDGDGDGDGDDTTGTTDTTDDATDDATEDSTDTGGVCGDNTVDAGEECDDGNTADGDGCSATCTISACALTWSWSEVIAGGTPGGYATVTDVDGNVYGVGEDEAGNAWAAKWADDGTLVWDESYGPGYGADLVLGDDGDLYVVGVSTNTDADIWFARLSGADGAEVWAMVEDSTLDDDIGTGIALATDGSVVVAGQLRIADGDDDVWVSKRSADDGSETWVSTWGGVGDGGFSTDRSSSVVVTDDDAIWVGAREHVDFDTQEATLLKFDAAGMEVDSWQLQGDGAVHQHESADLATDGTNVYYLIAKYAFPYRHWLYKLDGSDGAELWSKTEADWLIMDEEGEDFQIDGLAVSSDGNLLIGGEFANEDPEEGLNWGEAWVAQLDGAGELVCRSSHQVDDGDIIPPSLDVFAAGGSGGGISLTGVVVDNPDNSLWTGYFRL